MISDDRHPANSVTVDSNGWNTEAVEVNPDHDPSTKPLSAQQDVPSKAWTGGLWQLFNRPDPWQHEGSTCLPYPSPLDPLWRTHTVMLLALD